MPFTARSRSKHADMISILMILALMGPLLLLLFSRSRKNGKLPPAPPKLPLIGNLHQIGASPHKSLASLSKKYGDLMLLQMGSVPTLVVSSAKMAQEIFKSNDLTFSGRPKLYSVEKFVQSFDIAFAPYGEYWREVRKLTVLELLTAKRVDSFAKIRAEEVSLAVDEIAKASRSPSPGPFDLSSLAFRLTNTVVCRVAFGRRNDSVFEEIMKEVQRLNGEFNVADYFPWLGMINKVNGVDGRINKCKKELDGFFDLVIQEHLHRTKPVTDAGEDIVDVLLKIQRDPVRSINLTMDHLKAILLDVFVAGTDTATATIVWTMTELMRNPQVLEKLKLEVHRVGAGRPAIQEKDLPNLPFLKDVIKESLRLHPPAPLLLPRETTQACIIGDGFKIPKKTRVIINATVLSMDPEYWEKPEIFWPERFADGTLDYKGQHFGYLPFGAGRRICPGINFAVQLVELALANLILRYEWEPPAGIRAEDIDLEEEIGIVVHKKVPLCLVPKPIYLLEG